MLINYSYYLQGEKGFPGAPGYTGSQVTNFIYTAHNPGF